MRKTLLLLAFAAMAISCAKPTIIKQGEDDYDVTQRDEELFVYVDYHWDGGKFDDAVALERAFSTWGKEQGIFVYAMGRFPTMRDWQLGYVASGVPEDMEFQLREIKSMKLARGPYASMQTRGNVDYLFRYWRKLKKWLEKDGHVISGPVIEVYPDLMEDGLPAGDVRGELRYPLEGGTLEEEPGSDAVDGGTSLSDGPDASAG